MEKRRRKHGYDYEFVPTLDLKFECPICNLCLQDAIQTSCSHVFCQDCILQDRINKQEICCPLDRICLTEENIFPAIHIRQEIQDLKVKCPYIKNGCKIITELGTIEHHKSSCGYKMYLCDCGEEVCRKDTDDHQKFCTHSPTQCAYCKEKFPRIQKMEHNKMCTSLPISCKYCNFLVSRIDMENHIQKECPRAIVSCQFEDIGCPFSLVERQHLYDHNLKSLDTHISLLHRALNKIIQENRELNSQDIKGESLHSNYKSKNRTRTIRENKSRAEMHNYNDMQLNQALMIQNLKDNFERTIASFEKRLVSLEEKLTQGIFHWKIYNFPIHEQKAQKNTTEELKSKAFYSNPDGYRFFLRMILKKTEDNQLTLSLFVHLMMGENDDFLPWPFSGEIGLNILDQQENPDSKFHISKTMQSDPTLEAFQKPIREYNLKGFGYKKFTEVSTLHTKSYLKKDALIIRVKIRPNLTL